VDLDAVVKLWRETLDPATSLAAMNLAAELPDGAWPEDAPAQQAEWLARAVAPAGREVELMRAFDFVKLKADFVLERLATMQSWQPHPAVTHWLVDVFARQTRAPMLAGQKCFRRAFALLVDHIDHRGAARFQEWLGTHQERIQASAYGAKLFDDGMTRVLAKCAARLAAARALTPDERGRLEGAGLLSPPREPRREPTTEALLVYEAPWDDAPRLVLADFLQQRGDPRGEFITLDLLASPTAAQRKRRAALLKQHGKAWFPQALHRVLNRSASYERGFLARGELVADRLPIELATFRELTLRYARPTSTTPRSAASTRGAAWRCSPREIRAAPASRGSGHSRG
jgi:uncharacterized protein (TIGR02996 family)